MKRKSRKIDTSKKRCIELKKFKIINPAALLDVPVYSGEVFTIGGEYKYGMYRQK